MARSDGTFPKYEKIEINPKEWPTSYWNESMTCMTCDINWPQTLLFTICPDCHNETLETDFKPTYRWPEAVTKLLTAKFEDLYLEWDDATEIEETQTEVTKNEAIQSGA